MFLNMYLQEAVDKSFNAAPVVASIKKQMNTCQLAKFKSNSCCMSVYSTFFLSQLPDDVQVADITFENWSSIYTTLLNDDTYMKNLTIFMAVYKPNGFTGMFQSLVNLINSELEYMKENRVWYLSNAKAFFMFLDTKMNAVNTMIKAQVNDVDTLKFISVTLMVINTHISYLNKLIQREIEQSYHQEDITISVQEPLEEDAKELVQLLESYDSYMVEQTALNEGIVNNAKERAKALIVKEQKASKAFDELVMKQVRKIRENRRNRKHAEMVGEALRINHEIKRLLGSLAIGAINPAVGAIVYLTSLFYDRATDKRDRDVLVGQLKDELEIIEEKISQAERNGDDKGKVQLIRARQQLTKEYERINRIKYDPQRSIANRR